MAVVSAMQKARESKERAKKQLGKRVSKLLLLTFSFIFIMYILYTLLFIFVRHVSFSIFVTFLSMFLSVQCYLFTIISVCLFYLPLSYLDQQSTGILYNATCSLSHASYNTLCRLCRLHV